MSEIYQNPGFRIYWADAIKDDNGVIYQDLDALVQCIYNCVEDFGGYHGYQTTSVEHTENGLRVYSMEPDCVDKTCGCAEAGETCHLDEDFVFYTWFEMATVVRH